MMDIGILLMLVRKRFILADVLNLPRWMSRTASCTGFESGRSSAGCCDSLSNGYSDSMTTAMARASNSQGDHSLQLSFSLLEWNLTGRISLPLIANTV